MNLGDEFKEVWKKHNPIQSDQGKFILDSFIENSKHCSKIYFKSYYFLLILSLIYYFIDSKLIDHLEIFSVTVKNLVILKWAILPIFCFIFYQGLTAFITETFYRHAIWIGLNTSIPELTNRELEKMIYEPSIITFEFFQGNKYSSSIAKVYGLLIVFCIILVPIFLLIYIINQNINDWGNLNSEIFKWVVNVISVLLIIRIISIIYSFLKSIFKIIKPDSADL